MRNVEWVSMTDAERGQLVAIWLLAADHDGVIPASPDIIQKLCFLTDPPNINKFIELDFIESKGIPLDANTTPTRRQLDPPDKSRVDKNIPSKADVFFDLFWLNYPNKKGKAAAKKAWGKIKDHADVIEKMKITLPKQMESEAWLKNNGQFIPHPATYLNQGRWEDETI